MIYLIQRRFSIVVVVAITIHRPNIMPIQWPVIFHRPFFLALCLLLGTSCEVSGCFVQQKTLNLNAGVGMKAGWFRRIRQRLFKPKIPADIAKAQSLIHAIDRGGIPLNPGIVNTVARNLGLEVSAKAPINQTIERIRACLGRI